MHCFRSVVRAFGENSSAGINKVRWYSIAWMAWNDRMHLQSYTYTIELSHVASYSK